MNMMPVKYNKNKEKNLLFTLSIHIQLLSFYNSQITICELVQNVFFLQILAIRSFYKNISSLDGKYFKQLDVLSVITKRNQTDFNM